jgi:hypothetical protein
MSITKSNTALQTVVDFQTKIEAANTTMDDLERVIAEKELALAALQPSSTNMLQLQMQRENILAAMAIGTSGQNDLEKIDQAIADEQAKIEKDIGDNGGFIADITQTISGLKRKLEEEGAELAGLEFSRYHSVQNYLTSEAEQIGAEYLRAACGVANIHRRLLAIDRLMNLHQSGSTINKDRPAKLVIPLFNLNVHNGAESPSYPSELKDAVNTYSDSNCLDKAAQVERERIQKNGVML